MEEFPERLEFAIQEWGGGGKRAFARAMGERGVRGGTYRTLLNYLQGNTSPYPMWVEEAAIVLGVRAEWLSEGSGPMRDVDRGQVREEDDSAGFDIGACFVRCAGPELAQRAHHVVVSSWWNAVILVLGQCPDRDATTDDVEGIEVVGRWLAQEAVYIASRLRPGGHPTSRRDFNLYFNLMFSAIAASAPLPREGLTRDELLRRLGSEGGTDGTT